MPRPPLPSCFLAAALIAPASASASTSEAVLSFEQDEVPGFVEASGNSELALTSGRFIDGTQSLRWRWSGGPASLTIRRPIPIEPGPQRLLGNFSDDTFSPWIYTKEPMPGALRFTAGREGEDAPDVTFDFGMNFTGWRTAWVMYGRDTQGKPAEGMDELVIRTPPGVEEGEVFLDSIVLASVVDARHQYPDAQVPYVNPKAVSQHWLPRLDLLALAPDPAAVEVSSEETAAVEEVEGRIERLYLAEEGSTSTQQVGKLLEGFASYGIEEGPDGLRGRHLSFLRRQIVIYPDDAQPRIEEQFLALREYQEHMLGIAKAYRDPGVSDADRGRLRDAFVLMTRHFLDQGWASGSAQGTVHHLGYSVREVGPALQLMREALAEEGLLGPVSDAISWYFNTYAVFEPGSITTNMDYYNTLATGHLVSILLLPDGPAKVATLRRFSEMLGELLADETPGVENGFKSDGTAFHHFGHYPAYAVGAFEHGSTLIRALSGTAFEVSAAGRANFRRALMTMRLYADPDWAIGFAGRHPMPTGKMNAGMGAFKEAFVDTAFAGNPITGEAVDREVLAAALRIWPELGDRPEIAELGVEPEPTPEGHWTLNYAAAGIHRSADRVVTLKGYNRDVWSSEIYAKDNRYGRYQSNGSIAILGPGGNRESGFVQAGWDWNHVPGATGVHLPLEQLNSPKPGTLMLESPLAFAGDSNLGGEHGVFAINLEEDTLPGSAGLKARKSAFAFGPRIVALGTGIAGPGGHPTQTTLFQNWLPSRDTPIWLNGSEPVTAFPLEASGNADAASILVDAYGNGYVVPGGQDLRVRRQHQESRDDKTREPTEGDFALAWLDHGEAPEDASYRYTILLGADASDAARYAVASAGDRPPNPVLHQDNRAHAVLDAETGVTGLVAFEEVEGLDLGDSPVRSVDRPALVMSQPQEDGSLSLSVCDPALHLKDGESQPVQVMLGLEGAWTVEGDAAEAAISGGSTALRVEVVEGRPVQLTLRPR